MGGGGSEGFIERTRTLSPDFTWERNLCLEYYLIILILKSIRSFEFSNLPVHPFDGGGYGVDGCHSGLVWFGLVWLSFWFYLVHHLMLPVGGGHRHRKGATSPT